MRGTISVTSQLNELRGGCRGTSPSPSQPHVPLNACPRPGLVKGGAVGGGVKG